MPDDIIGTAAQAAASGSATSAGERRKLRMHPQLIFSIILRQAGTLGKAVLELVMNSADAGASKIEITLTSKGLHVTDDGRGFASRDEIIDFFETFGTPHETQSDSRFGRFRLGRGQIMAFARTVWKSGHFCMKVDVPKDGDDYDLIEQAQPFAGCDIEAELYSPLSPSDRLRLTDELRELCRYIKLPVIVDGVQINEGLDKQTWTFQDDDAYYLINPAHSRLAIYNQGAFVRNYGGEEVGWTGVIVSKRPLDVSMSRNDITVSVCAVYRRIVAAARALAPRERRKVTNTEPARQLGIRRLVTGGFDDLESLLVAVETDRCFSDYNSRHMSLMRLFEKVRDSDRPLVAPIAYSNVAEQLHARSLATVLSPKTTDRARPAASFDNVLERLQIVLRQFMKDAGVAEKPGVPPYTPSGSHAQRVLAAVGVLRARLIPVKDLEALVQRHSKVIAERDLKTEERLGLAVARKALNRTLARAAGQTERHLRVFEGEGCLAYTDECSTIVLNRKLLTIPGSLSRALMSLTKLSDVMLHEYLHEGQTQEGHDHPPEFFQRFHDLKLHDFTVGVAPSRAMEFYVRARQDAGMKMRATDRRIADYAGGEFDVPTQTPEDAGMDSANDGGQPVDTEAAA